MSAVGDEFVKFARRLPPFSFLDEQSLRDLGDKVVQVTYGRGTSILTQDGPASEHLMLVRQGGVRVAVRAADGEELIVDHRQAGGIFGYLSLLSADRSRAEVTTEEETTVYLIRREQVLDLIAGNPPFSEYFMKALVSKYIDRTFKDLHGKGQLYGSGDQLLFTTPVHEVADHHPPCAPASITAAEASRLMTAHNSSSLVLIGPGGEPAGILTDADLRQKVLAAGYGLDQPMDVIMTRGLITIDAEDVCLEALLKMIRHNIHHLIVTREGRLDGVVTNHDIMILQGASPLSLARDINRQGSVEGIVPVAKKVRGIVVMLLKSGATSGIITRVVTEINDRLVRKILFLAEEKFGPPPVPFCWIAFGSEGRKEQTISTDQDNAIIHDDPGSPEEAEAARDYFAGLSAWVNDALARCGFPPCSGNYMARNEYWRQPLSVWKGYFSDWISTPTPDAVLFSVILFDFRPIHGKVSLAEDLRSHLHREVGRYPLFLKFLAQLTVRVRPPLGFFGRLEVIGDGEHKNMINLKFRVIAPLLNIVRLFSLEKGVTETSTLRRMEVLRECHASIAELGDELAYAFEWVNLLRIRIQLDSIAAGVPPDNHIRPDKLSNMDRKTLRETCKLITRVQNLISRQYDL